MGNLMTSLKKPKGPEITEADRAVLSLKTQRRKLEDQEKLLGQRIEQQGLVARQLVAERRRDRALLALRKKKLSEQQMLTLHGLIMNVEELLGGMEIAKQQGKLFAVLKQGNEALKQLQRQVKAEDVHRLMEDNAEAKAYQDELQSALGQSLSWVDESEVEAELEGMENAMMALEESQLPKAPEVPAEALAAADLARLDAKVAAEQRAAQEHAAAAQAQSVGKGASNGPNEKQGLHREAHRAEPMLAS
ncbi:MAG: hypothetical protein WDW36_009867 [Sanguina aurantia]